MTAAGKHPDSPDPEAGKRVVLGRARSEGEAQLWVDVLRDEGIPATYFPDRRSGIFGAGGDFLAAFPVVVDGVHRAAARRAIRGLDAEAELVEEEPAAGSRETSRGLAAAGLLALVSVPAVLIVLALISWLFD